jgi:hypothetical protein
MVRRRASSLGVLLLATLRTGLVASDEFLEAEATSTAQGSDRAPRRSDRAPRYKMPDKGLPPEKEVPVGQRRSPHEIMARKKRMRTVHQLQEEAKMKLSDHQLLDKVNSEKALESSWAAREAEARGGGPAGVARDRLIKEMVTVLNATVHHEAGLAQEVATLRAQEQAAEAKLGAVEEDQEAEAKELAVLELGLAAALALGLSVAAAGRWRKRGGGGGGSSSGAAHGAASGV